MSSWCQVHGVQNKVPNLVWTGSWSSVEEIRNDWLFILGDV